MSEHSSENPARTRAGDVSLWHSLSVHDADRFIAWLRAVGFTEHETHRDETDPSVVVHAQWLWDGGLGGAGGLMWGSEREGGGVHNAGHAAAYLVTEDPDGFVARALEAGGTLVREVVEQPYGGRDGTVADPEGNHWSVGSYQPR
jgi:uncharacterized glyoxalase superfamily protein PhnB